MTRRCQLDVLAQIASLSLLVLFVIVLEEAYLVLLLLRLAVVFEHVQHVVLSVVVLLLATVYRR